MPVSLRNRLEKYRQSFSEILLLSKLALLWRLNCLNSSLNLYELPLVLQFQLNQGGKNRILTIYKVFREVKHFIYQKNWGDRVPLSWALHFLELLISLKLPIWGERPGLSLCIYCYGKNIVPIISNLNRILIKLKLTTKRCLWSCHLFTKWNWPYKNTAFFFRGETKYKVFA